MSKEIDSEMKCNTWKFLLLINNGTALKKYLPADQHWFSSMSRLIFV